MAAGLEGIEKKLDLPEADSSVGQIPETLCDALQAFSDDTFFENLYGKRYTEVYISEKMKEWESYAREVTDWEVRTYLARI